jgi:hypothetical protein
MLDMNRPRQDHNAREAERFGAAPIMAGGLLMIAIALVAGSVRANPCLNPVYTPFSRCGTGDITIGANGSCKQAYLDRSATSGIGKITIAAGGVLAVSDQAAQSGVTLTTTGIDIQSGGTLKIGDAQCPIGMTKATNRVTLKFTGTHPANCGDITKGPGNYVQCQGYVKGIQVESSGSLYMYGMKGVPAAGDASHTLDWTYLAKAAGPAVAGAKVAPASATQIIVAGDVTDGGSNRGWKPNDWIAIATTSFSPWETEFEQIKDLSFDESSGQTTIDLGNASTTQKLVYYHFGGSSPTPAQLCPVNGVLTPVKCGSVKGCEAPCTMAPSPVNYNDSAANNFGTDERAEVGLISRNIWLTSDADTPPVGKQGQAGGNLHWGGETRVLAGFKAFVMQGVQLQKFGKETLGSYPIHFHMDGDVSESGSTVLVDSNSVDHSYNKCITVHSTSNLTFTNNVCARITGHIFYEEIGDENNITFRNNVGMSAMSNSFSVNGGADLPADKLIAMYYWTGDNLNNIMAGVGNSPGKLPFDQFNIFNPDNQGNPVTGACFTPYPASAPAQSGTLQFNSVAGSCKPPNVYLEPPSGFWIINPSMKLINNSIAGCQDVGMGYWYVTPTGLGRIPNLPPSILNDKFIPIGTIYKGLHGEFVNNRVHGCYGGLYSDSNANVVSGQLTPYLNGDNKFSPPTTPPNHAVVDIFDQLTATRIRWRSLWVRPWFNVVNQSRFATNRRSLSFVTSGGSDGNYPGLWALLKDSVITGVSQNNVDRFGPCGAVIPATGLQQRGGQRGCIDATPLGPSDPVPASTGVYLADGFPTPQWNLFGFQIYDGPPLIVHNRFANFRADPGASSLLTTADAALQKNWRYNAPFTKYEGDAAFGWLENNQSAYPTAAASSQLSWTNVDFRHQIYTTLVNQGDFLDGDKNTAVIDLDGTLSGLSVGDSSGKSVPNAFPISLNGLPFNNTTNTSAGKPANSPAECHSLGQQNTQVEDGRPTGLMSPGAMGQLEFEALYPPAIPGWDMTQQLTFYKDNLDFGTHAGMALKSRNGLGVWEPKVISGYGYVVRADPYVFPPGTEPPESKAGIPDIVDITINDVVKPNLKTRPFYAQIGICYSAANSLPPVKDPSAPAMFTITKGYRTYGNGDGADPQLANDWVQLNGEFLGEKQTSLADNYCFNLDSQLAKNKLPNNCPARGITPKPAGGCPAGTTEGTGTAGGKPVSWCFYPRTTLEPATSLAGMTTNGQLNGPPNLNKYFYDSNTGMLYVWIDQSDVNAQGFSPLGNCTGNPATDPYFCTENTTQEKYYVCPSQGCTTLRIKLNALNYLPGVSNCPVFGPGGGAADWAKNTGGATWPGPPTTDQNFLTFAGTQTIAQTQPAGTTAFPYNDVTSSMLDCPETSP